MRLCPPTATELERAAALLPVRPTNAALLHLATPATAVIGVHVAGFGSRWCYRSHRFHMGADPLATAATTAALGHAEGDFYLDLSAGDPVSWVKMLRSGADLHAYGSDLLLGLPHLYADAALGADVLADTMRALVTGSPIEDVVMPCGATLERSRFGLRLTASNPATGAIAPATCEQVAAAVFGDRAAVESSTAVFAADGWEVRAPIEPHGGSALVGIKTSEVLPVVFSEPAPDGWAWVGVSRVSGGRILRHNASGVLASASASW